MSSKAKRKLILSFIMDFIVLIALLTIVIFRIITDNEKNDESNLSLEIHPPVETQMPDWMEKSKDKAIAPKANNDDPELFKIKKLVAYINEDEEFISSSELREEVIESDVVEPTKNVIELADENVWKTAAEYMARTLYGEDPHGTKEHQAGVYWVILNRVDSLDWFSGQTTPEAVCAAPGQFAGFGWGNPVVPEYYELALDVLGRWLAEKDGVENVGRVLPKEFRWFHGDGNINYFRDRDTGGNTWDWSLESPYE